MIAVLRKAPPKIEMIKALALISILIKLTQLNGKKNCLVIFDTSQIMQILFHHHRKDTGLTDVTMNDFILNETLSFERLMFTVHC